MLFERLTDTYTGSGNVGLTEINVGQCVTRELEPYIGQPIIFYAAGNLRIPLANHWSYTPMGSNPPAIMKQDMWLISNTNSSVIADVTKTINFGTEVDPYHLQAFNTGLYNTYWKDYITDLYATSRRVFMYKGQLPLGVMLALKINDKLTIGERNYIINQMKLNLTTGEAQWNCSTMYSKLGYLIKALKETNDKSEDVLIAKGKYQYPRTLIEALGKWR